MKIKFWQTKEFKELEKEWYSRLKEAGFGDAEKEDSGLLKQRASNCYRQEDAIRREAKMQYYILLGQALNQETEFRDDVERFVMERKAEGFTIERISEELKNRNERCYRGTIRKIIQKYEARWQVKKL